MQLYFCDDSYRQLIDQYEITEDQLQFTGAPTESITLSKEDGDRHSILAIEGEKLVSFFVLHKNAGVQPYTSNEHAILVRAFSTDFRHQGKGYAKKALSLLPAFVLQHFMGINEIILAVNVKNEAAQELYKKSGFIDEGVRRIGKKGELIIMSYYL